MTHIQTRPNPKKFDHTKSVQANLNQTKLNQTKPGEVYRLCAVKNSYQRLQEIKLISTPVYIRIFKRIEVTVLNTNLF